jgi:hypothetical protein
MKTLDDVNHARVVVRQAVQIKGLSKDQQILLIGLSVALCWVSESPDGSTLQRLLDGEPLAAGQTAQDVGGVSAMMRGMSL